MQAQEKQTDTMVAEEEKTEMCCDGSGRTADQHRAESPDGKCCVDG